MGARQRDTVGSHCPEWPTFYNSTSAISLNSLLDTGRIICNESFDFLPALQLGFIILNVSNEFLLYFSLFFFPAVAAGRWKREKEEGDPGGLLKNTKLMWRQPTSWEK